MLIVALWCAGTGFLACVTRVLSQARLALAQPRHWWRATEARRGWRGQRKPRTRACL